jgi:hypothetical protein
MWEQYKRFAVTGALPHPPHPPHSPAPPLDQRRDSSHPDAAPTTRAPTARLARHAQGCAPAAVPLSPLRAGHAIGYLRWNWKALANTPAIPTEHGRRASSRGLRIARQFQPGSLTSTEERI